MEVVVWTVFVCILLIAAFHLIECATGFVKNPCRKCKYSYYRGNFLCCHGKKTTSNDDRVTYIDAAWCHPYADDDGSKE